MVDAVVKAVEEVLKTSDTRSEGAYLAVFTMVIASLILLGVMWFIARLFKHIPEYQKSFHELLANERDADQTERQKDRDMYTARLELILLEHKTVIDKAFTEAREAREQFFQKLEELQKDSEADKESFLAALKRLSDTFESNEK